MTQKLEDFTPSDDGSLCDHCGFAEWRHESNSFVCNRLSNGVSREGPKNIADTAKPLDTQWDDLERLAMNIVYQIGDALYEALPKDVAHEHFVTARQATNDIAIDFVKNLITARGSKQKENWEKGTKQREEIAHLKGVQWYAYELWRSFGNEPITDIRLKNMLDTIEKRLAHLSPNKPKEAFGMELKVDPKVPDKAIRFDHPNGLSEGFIFGDDSNKPNQDKEG